MTSSLTDTLIHALHDGTLRPPAEALSAAAASLIDGISVSLAATGLEPAVVPFVNRVGSLGGSEEARFIGGGSRRVPAASAALVNGALAHALDFEDTFDSHGGHPNAIALSVLLAFGEPASTGSDVLRALAVGAEITCRLSVGVRADSTRIADWYHPPMIGAMGAVFGAADLLGLTPTEIRDALSLTMTGFALSSEIKRSGGSTLRGIRDGLAARAVVEAIELARHGVRGFELPLEGRAGFYSLLTGQTADDAAILDGLGSRWMNTDLTIKRWPTCRGTHAAIAIAESMRRDAIRSEDVDRISVMVSSPDEMLMTPLAQKRTPSTTIDAKFSIPFTVAAMLDDGELTLSTFTDIAPRALAQRFEYDGSFGSDPALKGLTRLDVTLRDGTRRRYEHERPELATTGSVELSAQRSKYDGCIVHSAPSLTAEKADEVFSALVEFGDRPVRALFDALA